MEFFNRAMKLELPSLSLPFLCAVFTEGEPLKISMHWTVAPSGDAALCDIYLCNSFLYSVPPMRYALGRQGSPSQSV